MDPLTEAPHLLALWGTGAGDPGAPALSALISGAETALTTASRGKLHGHGRARRRPAPPRRWS